jgi:hypothetical protein
MSDGIVDVEIYDHNSARVYQQYFANQNIASGEVRNYTVNWTPASADTYTVMVGEFNNDWSKAYGWNSSAATITVGGQNGYNPQPAPAPQPQPAPAPNPQPAPAPNPAPAPAPSGNQTTEVWWPSDGSTVVGVQPFKAMVQNISTTQYQMWWQVDGGQLNQMADSSQDYPHKEALVDVSGWHWQGSGPYTITFVSKDSGGHVISQKSVSIRTQ